MEHAKRRDWCVNAFYIKSTQLNLSKITKDNEIVRHSEWINFTPTLRIRIYKLRVSLSHYHLSKVYIWKRKIALPIKKKEKSDRKVQLSQQLRIYTTFVQSCFDSKPKTKEALAARNNKPDTSRELESETAGTSKRKRSHRRINRASFSPACFRPAETKPAIHASRNSANLMNSISFMVHCFMEIRCFPHTLDQKS